MCRYFFFFHSSVVGRIALVGGVALVVGFPSPPLGRPLAGPRFGLSLVVYS